MDGDVFGLVMEHDPNLVFIKDENSVVLFGNRAFLEVFAPEERGSIVGRNLVENFTPKEAELWLAEDRRALAQGQTEIVETVADYAGRRRTFLSRKIAFATAQGERRLLGISTDISELSQRERTLIETNDRLKRFGAFAVHDLRSPLATFVSAMNVIKADKHTTLSPQASQYMDLMIVSATHLAENVTAMLSVSKVEETTSVDMHVSDLNLLVEEVRFNLSSLVNQSGATIQAARLPAIVCEPGLFRQLLQNLVENSIKNRRDEERLHVLIRYERNAGCHRFFVEDNGRGIGPGAAEAIFEPFDQGGRSSTGASSMGVGIGLALCRRIVDIHGGTIRVDAAYEGGCRIEIVLPDDPMAERSLKAAA